MPSLLMLLIGKNCEGENWSKVEITRYSRQVLFAPIGREGQERLSRSRVAIVGMGALGTALSNHMVRSGVGFVRLIDRDFVEWSNLQRQMLFDEEDARQMLPKAVAGADKLRKINSQVTIEPVVADLTWRNAEKLLTDVDLILDGSDNFSVRYLINDVAVKYGIPWIYGGVVSANGMSTTVIPGETPCLACLFPEPPAPGSTPTCDTVGVIGPIVHVVAAYQATEALKLLVGDKKSLHGSLLHVDIWQNQHLQMNLSQARHPDCPVCVRQHFSHLQPEAEGELESAMCGRNTVQISPSREVKWQLSEVAQRLRPLGKVEETKFLVRFHVEPYTLVIFTDGRVMVQGTDDIPTARTLYAKYIGS